MSKIRKAGDQLQPLPRRKKIWWTLVH